MCGNGTEYPISSIRRAAGLVWLAGEVGINDDGSIPTGIAAQTDLTISRIKKTLEAEGLTLAHIVSATVHLADGADFAAFNDAYGRHLRAPFPVRTTVCAKPVDDVLVEITVVAAESI